MSEFDPNREPKLITCNGCQGSSFYIGEIISAHFSLRTRSNESHRVSVLICSNKTCNQIILYSKLQQENRNGAIRLSIEGCTIIYPYWHLDKINNAIDLLPTERKEKFYSRYSLNSIEHY